MVDEPTRRYIYTLIETGESTTYSCQHPAIIEFREDGSGVQIGGHTDGSEDTGNTDSDADWDPTIRINFT